MIFERERKATARAVQYSQKPAACCSGEGWGFYGRFTSGLSGLFSLVMDSQAFLVELLCLHLVGGLETILRAFCSSAQWQIYQTLYLLFRMQ
jgi:hypothetical protein